MKALGASSILQGTSNQTIVRKKRFNGFTTGQGRKIGKQADEMHEDMSTNNAKTADEISSDFSIGSSITTKSKGVSSKFLRSIRCKIELNDLKALLQAKTSISPAFEDSILANKGLDLCKMSDDNYQEALEDIQGSEYKTAVSSKQASFKKNGGKKRTREKSANDTALMSNANVSSLQHLDNGSGCYDEIISEDHDTCAHSFEADTFQPLTIRSPNVIDKDIRSSKKKKLITSKAPISKSRKNKKVPLPTLLEETPGKESKAIESIHEENLESGRPESTAKKEQAIPSYQCLQKMKVVDLKLILKSRGIVPMKRKDEIIVQLKSLS